MKLQLMLVCTFVITVLVLEGFKSFTVRICDALGGAEKPLICQMVGVKQ